MALERLNKSGRDKIMEAYQLNPYSRVSVQYMIMSELSELKRLEDDPRMEQRNEIKRRIGTIITTHEYLFPKNEPWIDDVQQLLKAL